MELFYCFRNFLPLFGFLVLTNRRFVLIPASLGTFLVLTITASGMKKEAIFRFLSETQLMVDLVEKFTTPGITFWPHFGYFRQKIVKKLVFLDKNLPKFTVVRGWKIQKNNRMQLYYLHGYSISNFRKLLIKKIFY